MVWVKLRNKYGVPNGTNLSVFHNNIRFTIDVFIGKFRDFSDKQPLSFGLNFLKLVPLYGVPRIYSKYFSVFVEF